MYFRYLFIGIFLLLIYLSYLIIKPFFTIILAGALIAYIANPLYRFLHKYIKSKNIAALIVSVFLILLITIPSLLLISPVISQTQYFYLKTKQIILTTDILGSPCAADGYLCKTINYVQESLADPATRLYMQDAIKKVTNTFIDQLSDILFTLPKYLLAVFITFFITFYLFTDGDKLITQIKHMIPVAQSTKESIFKKIKDIIFAVIYGAILIALLQGLLATIGYFVVGINAPLLWGAATALFALVPFIGTAFVWVPLSIGLIVTGVNSNDPTLMWKGVGLLVYGALIIGTIDNLLKPKLIGEKAGIHPVLVLLGALGGILVFGVMGFLVGPVILALLVTFIDLYEQKLYKHKKRRGKQGLHG